MRVLVTGHLGYIGSVLTPMLIRRGHLVVGLDSDLFGACTFGPMDRIVAVPALRKDIRDATEEDLQGFDAIMHLAALSNDPLGDINPDLTYEINHRASVRLAEIARRVGVGRFIFSSSCSNYGASGCEALLDESAELNPITAYGQSKVYVERDVSALADDSFSPVFLRNATAYGLSPRLRFDIVVNNLTAWATTTGEVRLKSDGSAWRPLVHVEDICRAFLAALEAPRELVHNEAFNVGRSEENYQIRDVAQIVQETVPRLARDDVGGGVERRPELPRELRQVLPALRGLRPRWDVRRGAAQLYDAFRKAHLTAEEFEGPRYKRIAHLRSSSAPGGSTSRSAAARHRSGEHGADANEGWPAGVSLRIERLPLVRARRPRAGARSRRHGADGTIPGIRGRARGAVPLGGGVLPIVHTRAGARVGAGR